MISRLKLMDFRCYGSFSWQIPQQGAIILGNNARGKPACWRPFASCCACNPHAQPGPGLWSPTENNPSASAENFRGKSGASCGRRTLRTSASTESPAKTSAATWRTAIPWYGWGMTTFPWCRPARTPAGNTWTSGQPVASRLQTGPVQLPPGAENAQLPAQAQAPGQTPAGRLHAPAGPARHGTEKPARPSAGAPGAPYRPGLPQYRRKAGTGLHRLPRLGGRRPV